MKFADPKNDIAFKKIFGDENKKEILISFLNNLLNFAGTTKEIIDFSLTDHYQDSKLEKLRQTTLTINVIDKRNIHYIIEIIVIHTEALEKRVMYYVSKAYSQQLNRAEDYPRLNQVIFLGFLDFVLFKENPSYTTRHLILEESTNGHYFKDFELNFVELPKFEKSLKELSDVKEKWIYFVKNASDLTIIPKEMEEPKEIREAFEVANQLSWTKEELDAYDKKGIYIQDERGRIEYAKEEGREAGKKEKALEIAKTMLNKGIPIDTIVETTGLPKEEIKQ
ncbi:MAG: Rpn family recombination-promoting nuclease/putative transposase [Candidatus Aminicenantes bacterium]|nr:Rpn family recombination-promoting nuclease/putative transposase [Candidatus Aminicenantes bacterium]